MSLSKQFAATGDIPMFATAKEIIEGTILHDGFRHEHDPDTGGVIRSYTHSTQPGKDATLEHKYEEATQKGTSTFNASLKDAIVDNGYDWKAPVTLLVDEFHPDGPQLQLWNGHHRVAVMAEHRPDEQIPIHVYSASKPITWLHPHLYPKK